MKDLHDIKYNIVESVLKRPIQIIPPDVHKDKSFIVPGLMQGTSSFSNGIGMSVQETQLGEELYRSRNRKNSLEISLNRGQQSTRKDTVLSKIDERLERSLLRINQ